MADLFESLALRPQLARTLARHLEASESGTLERRTQELCALMVAWLNACERCAETHAGMARELGVEAETLDALADFARSERFVPRERAALAAAVALTREPRGLPDPVRVELQRYFEPAQIVDLVATIGLHNYLTRASNALRGVLGES